MAIDSRLAIKRGCIHVYYSHGCGLTQCFNKENTELALLYPGIHQIRTISRSGLESQKSGVTKDVQILQDNMFWYMFHCPVHLIATLLPLKKSVHTSSLSIWFHPSSSIYQGISSSGLHSSLSSSPPKLSHHCA